MSRLREVDERPPYVGWKQVAEALGVTERTAQKLPARGLRVHRDAFRRVIVHRRWLEEWQSRNGRTSP